MTPKKTQIKCRSCGFEGTAEIGKTLDDLRDCEIRHRAEEQPEVFEAGHCYEFIDCPSCHVTSIRRYYWNGAFMEGRDVRHELIFPAPEPVPDGLPSHIVDAWDAALKVRSISPNAYGVLAGRILEEVCQDKGAKKTKLGAALKELTDNKVLSPEIGSVAQKLVELRHAGAHSFLGNLSEEEVPIVSKTLAAVLQYVYSAPKLAQEADCALQEIRGRAKAKKKQNPNP